MSHFVEQIGCSQSRRSRTDNGNFFARAVFRRTGDNHSLIECVFNQSRLVFATRNRFARLGKHARFFAQRRTNTSRKFREIACLLQFCDSFAPFPFVHQILPFRVFVSERTRPVAERHATVHTARCLQFSVFKVQRLLNFAEIGNSFVYWTIARLFSTYRHKCFWISHNSLIFND